MLPMYVIVMLLDVSTTRSSVLTTGMRTRMGFVAGMNTHMNV